MWVLVGVSDDTIEKETFVYFIGIFDNLTLAKEERKRLIVTTNSNQDCFFIKSVIMNASYNYDWCNSDENEVKV